MFCIKGEKPEICQWCGKGFNGKATLRNHERLHTGIYSSINIQYHIGLPS